MTVSLCIVAYNEQKQLPLLLEDIKKQDYPKKSIEIVLVDSMSSDGTLAVMNNFAAENPEYIRVIVNQNPKKIQAPGWNIAIETSKEDVIIKLDAHSRIPSDFVSKNIECLKTGEFVSGGPRPNVLENDTPWQKVLLTVESSLFGSGISEFRHLEKKKYVKSMFHAACKREVYEKTGSFNELLGRTEDNEMNYRIRKNGYKLCYDPSIKSYQYVRSSLPKMIKQKFLNGYWVMLTLKVCPKCLSVYYFVPFAFVLSIIFSFMCAANGFPFLSILLWSVYGIFAVATSIHCILHSKKHVFQILLPVLFLTLHVSYGLGSLVGLFKLPFFKVKDV